MYSFFLLFIREIPQRSNHSTIEFQMQSRYNHNEDPSSGNNNNK